MTDGKVDVVLEDWNNIYLKVNKRFTSGTKAIVNLGSNGVIGHIGWFIPTYLMKQHPEFKTWRGGQGEGNPFQRPRVPSPGGVLRGGPPYRAKGEAAVQGARPGVYNVSPAR